MKSKTNIGGLLSAIGLSLSGGGVLAQLTQLFPSAIPIPNGVLIACWYIALAGVIMKVAGSAMTAYYAADANDVAQNAAQVAVVAAAVDKINQTGPSSDTALISKPTTPTKP